MENSTNGYTLMVEKPNYRKSQGTQTPNEVQRMQRVPYASAIGSRFQQNPGEIQWTTVKTILKYLRNTKDMVLVYGENPKTKLKVSCYASFKLIRTIPNPKQGMCSYLMVEPWTGRVPSKASMEAVWMRKFIDGLGGVVPSNKRPMKMLCDNEPAIAIANDPGILKGAKHFQRKYHYIREVIQECETVLKKVYTDDNVADPFTKPTPYNKHYERAMTIGI
ncbi:hypothetical protein Tco_1431353, partial [Tanacetum coccineum]